MKGFYAKDTSVSVEKSRCEIEKMLGKYGGVGFAYGHERDRAMLGFKIKDSDGVVLGVRITLPLPDPSERRFTHTPNRDEARHPDRAYQAWEQECRALWRALALVVKAKLEACAVGISTIEREFMPDLVMPNGRTLTETIGGDVRRMLETTEPTRLLTGAA